MTCYKLGTHETSLFTWETVVNPFISLTIFVSGTSLIALFPTVIYCNYSNLVLPENIISETAHRNMIQKNYW